MTTRRTLILVAAAGLLARTFLADRPRFEIDLIEVQWRDRLSPGQFAVLRDRKTEHAWTNHIGKVASPLLDEARAGSYACAGCGLPVYRSEVKYDSSTGWPSFWEAVDDAVLAYDDSSFFIRRTGLECRRCGGHLGHGFDDGPPPTAQRHCINGLALTFTPDATGMEEGHPVARG